MLIFRWVDSLKMAETNDWLNIILGVHERFHIQYMLQRKLMYHTIQHITEKYQVSVGTIHSIVAIS